MRRRAALVAVWVLGTLGSMALAWTAVSRVGGEVTADSVAVADETTTTSSTVASTTTTAVGTPTPATVAGTETAPTTAPRSPATSPAAPPPAPAPPPPAPPPPPPSSTKVFDTAGGAASVRCTGNAAELLWATPRSGFSAEVHDAGPERVEVRFESDDGEVRLRVSCQNGTPVGGAEEGGGSGPG